MYYNPLVCILCSHIKSGCCCRSTAKQAEDRTAYSQVSALQPSQHCLLTSDVLPDSCAILNASNLAELGLSPKLIRSGKKALGRDAVRSISDIQTSLHLLRADWGC